MSRRYPLHQLADCLPITRRSVYKAARLGRIHYLHKQDPHGRAARALWVDLDELETHYRHRPQLLGKILERVAVLELERAMEAAQG